MEIRKIAVYGKDGKERILDFGSVHDSQNSQISQNAENIQNNKELIEKNTQADSDTRAEILAQISDLKAKVELYKAETDTKFDELRNDLVNKTDLNASVDKIQNSIEKLKAASILTNSLETEVQALAAVINSKKSNVQVIEMSEDSSKTIVSDGAVEIIGSSQIEAAVSVQGNGVDIIDLNVKNAPLDIVSSGIINLNDVKTEGGLDRKVQGNANLKLNNSDVVRISGCNFKNKGYNQLEIGLKAESAPKAVVIENCEFGDTSNNSISVFNTADNAVITVKNCKFGNVSNLIRLSNRDNVHCTLNLINCEIESVDSDPQWNSVVICQDYTSKTIEDAEANNLFSPDKVKINFADVTVVGEKIEKIIKGVGTGFKHSLVYVWNSAGGLVQFTDGNEGRYPEVTVQ